MTIKDIDIEELTQVIADAMRDWFEQPVSDDLYSHFIAERVLAHLTDGGE